MSVNKIQDENNITLDELAKVLDSGAIIQARSLLNSLYPSEIADVIEGSPRNRRDLIWKLVSNENKGEALAEMSEEIRGNLLDELIDQDGTEGLAKIAEDLDTAGGLMNTDTINIRSSVTVEVLLKYIRRLGKLPEQTDIIFVTDIMNKYFGYVSIQDLLISNPSSLVSEIMIEDKNIIDPDTDKHEVAKTFEDHDLLSAAVVDKDGVLLGRITVDDVVDVIRDEAEDSVLNMAGLNKEDDIFAPIFQSTKRRTVWLGANLLTAILAAAAIGIFEATIEKVVALAILMPIVASMGGIAGMQSLALVIRSQATNQIGESNSRLLIIKESLIGVLNGILWSSIVAVAVYLWFDSVFLGTVIASALMINLIIGAISGVSLPLILKKMDIDPALAGGVILTTITDIVGFISLLGVATIIM